MTRLTHTLEVSQVARTLSRALNLNEDLAEAIALGHDLGHTPFGHIGEEALASLREAGFRHNRQSLRIVEKLENAGIGLNLTWEVRQGILRHSKPRGDFLKPELVEGLSIEAQIVRVSDAIAYLNHDLEDAFRAKVVCSENLPSDLYDVLDKDRSRWVNTFINDIVENSWHVTYDTDQSPTITMSQNVRAAFNNLREFMFHQVYIPEDLSDQGETAKRIIVLLYRHFDKNPDKIPAEYKLGNEIKETALFDYISGMTDYYALRTAETIAPGITAPFSENEFIL